MKLKELKPQDYVIYVDLDGVLADLHSHIEKVLGEPVKVGSNGSDWINADEIWKKLRKMNEPDFSKLKMLTDAKTLWNYIKKYNPHILTATGKPEDKNARGKRKWVKKHLSGYDQVHTVFGSAMKAKFAWPDAILIDDRMKSIGPWRKKGGIGILHKSAADTISQLKKLGL